MEIRVQSQNIERALRDLKKKLQLDGLFGELKTRRHYEKPSVKKKRKQLEAQKRARKLLRRRTTGSGPRPYSAPRSGPASAGQAGSPQAAPETTRS